MRLENGGSLDLWTKMQIPAPSDIMLNPSATRIGPYTRLFVQVRGSSLAQKTIFYSGVKFTLDFGI